MRHHRSPPRAHLAACHQHGFTTRTPRSSLPVARYSVRISAQPLLAAASSTMASEIDRSCAAAVDAARRTNGASADITGRSIAPRIASASALVRPSLRVRTACSSIITWVLITASAARSRNTSRARACFSGEPSSNWYARTFVSRNVVTGRSPSARHRAPHATTRDRCWCRPVWSRAPRTFQQPPAAVPVPHRRPRIPEAVRRGTGSPTPPLQRPDPSAPERLVISHDRQVRHLTSVELNPCYTADGHPETAPLEGSYFILELPRTGRPPHSMAQLTSCQALAMARTWLSVT